MRESTRAIHAYDNYGDFNFKLFFAGQHDLHCSRASVHIDVPNDSSIYRKGLASIDLDKYKLKAFHSRWDVSSDIDDEERKDHKYLERFNSELVPLCMELELLEDQINLEFYYDCASSEIEEWVINSLQNFRKVFGHKKSPEFRVLKVKDANYATTKVKIKSPKFDLDRFYNDSFNKVDALIKDSFISERSGLILLYGLPGTGKSTYIKSLVREYPLSKFIFVPNEFVKELLHPNFIAFMVKQTNAVLIIEDAEKVISARSSTTQPSVVSTLLQLTDGLFSDYLNLKVICTFNTDVSKIDKALFRKGRMIASYEFEKLSIDKVKLNLPHQAVVQSMTLADVFNLKKPSFDQDEPRSIGFGKRT